MRVCNNSYLCCFITGLYSFMETFDIIVLTLALIAFIAGFITGLIMQLTILGGVILSSFFSGQLADWLSPLLTDWIGNSPHIIKPLSYMLSFIVIFTLLIIAGKLIQSLFKAVKINIVNRFFGGLSGLLTCLFIISVLLNIVAEVDKNQVVLTHDIRENSLTYKPVREISTVVAPYLRFDR